VGIITDWWNGWLTGLFTAMFDAIARLLISVGGLSAGLIHWGPVVNAMLTIQVFATAVLGLKVGLDIYSRYILQLSGEDSDPLDAVLLRAFGAAALIWSVPLAVTLAVDVGNKLTADVLMNSAGGAMTGVTASGVMTRLQALNLVAAATGFAALIYGFVELFIGIGLVVIFFQIARRMVELAIMVFIGPMMALNFASPDRSLFSAWVRQLLSLTFTQTLQLYLLNLTIIALMTGLTGAGITDPLHEFVVFVGLMTCTITLPAFVAQMTHQATPSGVAALARTGVGTAVQYGLSRMPG
jgi:hypothetical protein